MAIATEITVPLLDLKAQYATIRDEIEPVIREVVESQWFIGGPQVSGLEEECAEYCGVSHAVGCASGSDAIVIAMDALGIGRGDSVIVPTYTFFATAGSVHRVGARPIFVDVDPVTYNIDPASIREAFTAPGADTIKAIMPVHLFGQVADMDEIMSIASEHGVAVVEDSAQSIGSVDVHGRRAGSIGTIGTFSFFPSKNLGGFGDGGLCSTNDEALAGALNRLRNHGMEPKYYHKEVGRNARLDALQAAVLRVKLRHLDNWTEARRANARYYDEAFGQAGARTSATPLSEGGFPLRTPEPAGEGARHIYNQYVVRVPAELRDQVRTRMADANIGTEIYYPLSLHQQECFADLSKPTVDLGVSEQASKETIALPIYPELSEAQKAHVVNTLVAALG
ncbi:MAG: DegT/DnrJ/EryC1/StrS family aminotransferase [Phycisphaerales bacterium]|nr:DegT/DnrJ/EryC1/StrS family aminotransferase [Phycisphaerales bacterium]